MFDLPTRKRPRFILIIGDEGVLLTPFDQDGEAVVLFAAARDEKSQKEILTCLERSPHMPVTIMANGTAQEFRIETLPPLNVLDRSKLVQRRLRQAFPQAYATASHVMDRTHALLAGLPQGTAVASWMGVMNPANVSLGLLPIEAAGLVTHLLPEAKKGWAMLLAQFRTGGLRQIVTCDGQLVFTRQTQALPGRTDPKRLNDMVLRVIEDSRGYLARFGLTESADLRVALIFGRNRMEAVADDTGAQKITFFSPHQVAEKLSLALVPDDESSDSDLVFAGWIAKQAKLSLPVMPPAIKRKQQEALIAHIGMRAACVFLAVALGVFGWNASQLAVQAYENSRAAGDVASLRKQLVEQEAALAPAAQPLGRLRAALERQRLFMEPQTEPWDVLRQVGEQLQGEARLASLDWRDNETLRADIRMISAKDATNPDRETIVHNFKALAEKLAHAMPGYSVEVTRYPFPATPQEILTNVGGDAEAAPDAATAGLTIRRRL